MGQSVPFASLQTMQTWKQWLICQRILLSFRGTSTGWRNRLTGTLWSSRKPNAKSHTRRGITTCSSIGLWADWLESNCTKGSRRSWGTPRWLEWATWFCTLTKTNRLLGGINKSIRNKQVRECVYSPLFNTGVPDWCVHPLPPQWKKEMDTVDQVQQIATKMNKKLKHLSYEKRLR